MPLGGSSVRRLRHESKTEITEQRNKYHADAFETHCGCITVESNKLHQASVNSKREGVKQDGGAAEHSKRGRNAEKRGLRERDSPRERT
ncbi:hypothetical protein LSTR_LSTR000409 [Laodelphax striatellus]|uniref:Uncharacterized protein n=1 Tax=Laodelphax striatellus TaxID=195883 RepID=A0A482X551_LAOST|nr:hypothetical protein LSTR_LSTR000409 [Laodelphax striatellus]